MMDLFPTPARYVLQYRPGEDDTLVVSLDGEAIGELLRRAGYAVWGSDRPLTLVWVAVDRGSEGREIIAADDPDDTAVTSFGPPDDGDDDSNRLLRERIVDAAERRGIPLLFPLLDTEDLRAVSFSDVWGGFDEALLDASRRYGTSSILVGRVRDGDAFGNRWSYYYGSQRLEWSGGPENAVNLLADALAEQFAYAGNAPVENVNLTISGIDGVGAFGTVQRMLASQTVIESYRIDIVEGDQIRYDVAVRGGIDRLASALEFSGVLERPDWLDADRYFGGGGDTATLDYVFKPYAFEPDPPAAGEQPDAQPSAATPRPER